MAQSPSVDDCKQFKAIVVTPPDDIDKRFEAKPSDQVEAKGIVVNPCKLPNIPVLNNLKSPFVQNNLWISNRFQLSNSVIPNLKQRLPRMSLPLSIATKKLLLKPAQAGK